MNNYFFTIMYFFPCKVVMIFNNFQAGVFPGNVMSANAWAGEIIANNLVLGNSTGNCLDLQNMANPGRFYRVILKGCAIGLNLVSVGSYEFYGSSFFKNGVGASITGFKSGYIRFFGCQMKNNHSEGLYMDKQNTQVFISGCKFSNNNLDQNASGATDADVSMGPDIAGITMPTVIATFDGAIFDSDSTDENFYFVPTPTYCLCEVMLGGNSWNLSGTQPTSNNASLLIGPQFQFGPQFVTQLNATNGFSTGSNVLLSQIAPTIASGFGSGSTLPHNNGTGAFQIIAGSGSPTTGSITLPTAANGWTCTLNDVTHAVVITQTGSSTTSAAFTAASALTTSDQLNGSCHAF